MRILAMLIVLVSAAAFTKNTGSVTMEEAEAVKLSIIEKIGKAPGVNGIGIGGCDPKTGIEDVSKLHEFCVAVRVNGKEELESLLRTYPAGTRINGVFISLTLSGKIIPNPRMSGGN